MAKLFNKIRKELVADKPSTTRTANYLKYAIGEIVLVVFGILIALQINTWNQNRISKIEEKTILKNIHNEFLQNNIILKSDLEANIQNYKTTRLIMNIMGKHRYETRKYNMDSLLYLSLEFTSFRPSENSITDLLQSGGYQILHNNQLKSLLNKWNSKMESYKISSKRSEKKIDDDIIPYLTKNYSMKDIDQYGDLKWKKKSLIKIDKIQIFEDIEFENLMDDFLYRSNGTIGELKSLENIIDQILKETN